jgi:signal transduction histidine kinase/CheY-like chemotaxis protein
MLYRILICLFISFGIVTTAQTAPATTAPLKLTSDDVLNLSSSIMWCATDPEHTIESVTHKGCDFQQVRYKRDLNQGLSDQAYWIKFTLYNPSSVAISRWLRIGHPRLQSVALYTLSAGRTWHEIRTGLDVPLKDRPIIAEVPVLPLEIDPYSVREYYVRISAETTIDLSSSLLTPRAFLQSQQFIRFAISMSLGAAALAVVFCLMAFLRVREKSFLLLAGTLVCTALYDAGYTGLAATLVWPAHISYPIGIQAVMTFLALLLFCAFMISLIPNVMRLKKFKAVTLCCLAGLAIATFWAVQISYRDAITYISIFSALTIIFLMILVAASRDLELSSSALLFWCLGPTLLVIIVRLLTMAGLAQFQVMQSIGFCWALTILSPVIITGIVKRAEEHRRKLAEIALDTSIRIELLGQMSHDFRSPLNSIINYANLIVRNSPRVTVQEAMTAIQQSGYELLSLVDSLLDYMRRNSSEVSPVFGATSLTSMLNEISSEAMRLTRFSDNRFELNVSDALPHIANVDQSRLKQVLRNLISNANRYTMNGIVVLNCHAEPASESRSRLSFSVVDTGVGIDPKDISRIFDPYVRGISAQRSGPKGFGIGLALSAKIIESMGSKISVISSLGEGSKFSFTIDCEVIQQSRVPTTEDCDSSRHCRVLAVDDDPQALLLLQRLLGDQHFEIITADNGEEAKRLMAEGIDLVITDQFMNYSDGWTVLQRAAGIGIPVILISAADPQRPPDLDETIQFAAVFQKPIDNDALKARIASLLGLSLLTAEPHHEHLDNVLRIADVSGRLDEEQLLTLRKLVCEGAVSEIERWIDDSEPRYPGYESFFAAVRSACTRLDFRKLTRLATEGKC